MTTTYHLYTDPCGIGLIAYSVATVALIAERMLTWRKIKRQTKTASAQVQELLAKPDRGVLTEAFSSLGAPLGWVMTSVLKHGVTNSPETTLLLLDDSLDEAAGRLKRNLTFLASLAGTAPFLGLLGTVLGIMNTFSAIVKQGFGGPVVISAGISQALQTTAAGLLIAIPAFIAYNLFTSKANDEVRQLRQQANRILVALGDL